MAWDTRAFISTGGSAVAGTLVAGVPGSIVGGAAGFFVSLAFLVADNAKDTRTVLKKLVDALYEFVDNDTNMKEPLRIEAIVVPTIRYGLSITEYDFPVNSWNGSVYNAVGESLCCGDFQYNKYPSSELLNIKTELNQILKESIK